MSVYNDMADKATDNRTVCPVTWAPVRDGRRPHAAVAAWEHPSGLTVTVERTRRPDQMHDARTSRDDTGYTARVYDSDGTNARLCAELASQDSAQASARAFMRTYPDGDFAVPEPGTWGDGAVQWRRDA